MTKSVIETLAGFIVIAIAAWFLLFFVNKTSSISITGKEYKLFAKFDDIGSITEGSSVKIGGVKIGVVSNVDLDPKTYEAIAEFSLDQGIKIPQDSSVKIASDGILGGKFIAITPGAEDIFIDEGGELKFTQSAINLESLIGKMIYGVDKKEKK